MAVQDIKPVLSDDFCPPLIGGAERLTALLMNGVSTAELLVGLSGPFAEESLVYAALFDTAVLAMLLNQRMLGLSLQHDLLAQQPVFRIASERPGTIRVLAIAAPGDLQMNMPIEFITAHLDVRLDLLFLVPSETLPAMVPDHDVAFCVISDADPQALQRAAALLTDWPRPVLNHPGRIAGGCLADLTRDGYARMFADVIGIHAPATCDLSRVAIAASLDHPVLASHMLPDGVWPILIRPHQSHAGAGLARITDVQGLQAYLRDTPDDRFHVSSFVDYRDPDQYFRKLRVALISGQPFLCHMGVSEDWMIHYLNAGMEHSDAKRADEARAMAEFTTGFAVRHAAAFAALHVTLGLDYVVLDCAQGPDGRLLLFEVEMAAIVHRLDPVTLFPYKPPQMARVFEAFRSLLAQACGQDHPARSVLPHRIAA